MPITLSTTRDQKVLVEQIHSLYSSLPPILAVNLVVSSALVFGLWDVVAQKNLIVWLGLMLLVLIVRMVNYVGYRIHFKPQQANQHGLYFVLGGGVTGILWGVGSVVFFPEHSLEYQLFILCVLIGMGAGSISSLTMFLPAFYAYLHTSFLPIYVKLFSMGDTVHIALGMMTVAYVAALSYFGLNINRTFLQSLKLRFENLDLVEQLRAQKNDAEQANISKTRFLAAASHDLRQPLHALSLFTSVLDDTIRYPKARRVVDQIKASVNALQCLFNALLDISRLEAGVMKVEKTDFILQPLFEKLANDFNPQASEKELQMAWPDCDFATHSDQALLEQILRNYIGNAIRYTDSGSVNITCEAENGQLLISVIDTGPGIPEQEREMIFEEFHQLGNPERDRSKGLGLGLAIVQRAAQLLEHSIQVESTIGQGSVFSITVDRVEKGKVHDKVVRQVDEREDFTHDALIIVIDDEVSILEGMESLLNSWGCNVIAASSQQEAMQRLAELNLTPDGVIADFRLRENQTGINVIQAFHEKFGANIPSLIVTGDTAVDLLHEVNDSGFQVLHKPVAPVKLRTFLRNVQLRKQNDLAS